MPVAIPFVPSRVGGGHFRDWQTPVSGDNGKPWAWDHAQAKYVPTAFEAAGAVAAHVALADPHSQYLLESGYTAADVFAKVLTQDGASSGLDADLLQGTTPSAYALTLVDDADASTARSTLGLGTLATVNVPGATTQIISNQAGVLAGDAGLTYDPATDALTVAGPVVMSAIRVPSDSTNAWGVDNAAGTTRIIQVNSVTPQLIVGGDRIKTDRWLSNDTNTVVGVSAMGSNNLAHTAGNEGYYNTAIGYEAARLITTGFFNVAIGTTAMRSITTGSDNVAIGNAAMYTASSAASNMALGNSAMRSLTTGSSNVALGFSAGYAMTSGFNNVAIGADALKTVTTAQRNTAIGVAAGRDATGSFSVFIGERAGRGETNSSRLHIANINTKSLLLGDFANDALAIGFTNLTVPTATLHLAHAGTARAQLRFDPTGAADPTSPNDGDHWYNSRLKFRRSSTTEIIPSAAAQSAYTQTYSTSARTVNAYTTDAESSAYTGIDNAQGGTVYAQLSDLNSLRTAYENLRAMADNLIQVVNALIDDGQAFGMT